MRSPEVLRTPSRAGDPYPHAIRASRPRMCARARRPMVPAPCAMWSSIADGESIARAASVCAPANRQTARAAVAWSHRLRRRPDPIQRAALRAPGARFGAKCAAGIQPARKSQPTRGLQMNWDRIEGNWKQFKGGVKQQWGKLTDSQIDTMAGKRDQLAGKIQETYGISREESE